MVSVFHADVQILPRAAASASRLLGGRVFALFDGSSGTGKTLAAEVITRDPRFDTYQIDLTSTVSK